MLKAGLAQNIRSGPMFEEFPLCCQVGTELGTGWKGRGIPFSGRNPARSNICIHPPSYLQVTVQKQGVLSDQPA